MGIYGNEQADKLANLSLTQPQHCSLILKDAVKQISTQIREQWHIAWHASSSKLRKYKPNISALLPAKLTIEKRQHRNYSSATRNKQTYPRASLQENNASSLLYM